MSVGSDLRETRSVRPGRETTGRTETTPAAPRRDTSANRQTCVTQIREMNSRESEQHMWTNIRTEEVQIISGTPATLNHNACNSTWTYRTNDDEVGRERSSPLSRISDPVIWVRGVCVLWSLNAFVSVNVPSSFYGIPEQHHWVCVPLNKWCRSVSAARWRENAASLQDVRGAEQRRLSSHERKTFTPSYKRPVVFIMMIIILHRKAQRPKTSSWRPAWGGAFRTEGIRIIERGQAESFVNVLIPKPNLRPLNYVCGSSWILSADHNSLKW